MFYRDDLLRAAAAAQRKSHRVVAEETGLNRMTVGRVLDGDPKVGYLTIFKIAQALGFEDMSQLTVSVSGPTEVGALDDVLPREKIA